MTGSTTNAETSNSTGLPAHPDTGSDPGLLDLAAMLQLIQQSPEGIAVIDAEHRYLQVNPAGCELLGRPESALLGGASPWRSPVTTEDSGPGDQLVSLGRREFAFSVTEVQVRARQLRVVQFRDVTDARHRERQLRTFAKTAASIAFSDELSTLLDRLAEEVRQATGMYSCTFLLYDESGELQQSGTAGEYPRVQDYSLRLRECRALGAPLVADDSVRLRRPIIASGWRQKTLDDPRFAPIHEFTREAKWNTLVVVPLLVRDRVAGVFNGFYLTGHEPHEADLPFLTAIADQAAVAVDNSQLLAAAERQAALEERHRLARELHDSVSQVLFSLSLQTQALEIVVGNRGLESDAALHGGLREIRELTHDAVTEMRALIFQLRPAALHEEGLVSAVRKHASALAAREGLEITVSEPAVEMYFDASTEEQIFRVVQEALHNVVKHVPGGRAHIEILATGPDLLLEVTDNGTGFDPDVQLPGHYGMQTMSERVSQAGGTLTVESCSSGTTVRAFLPNVIRPEQRPARADEPPTRGQP
jgi:signal transduction histidine kinase